MVRQIKLENIRTLAGTFVAIMLLTACGAGTDINNAEAVLPDIGAANPPGNSSTAANVAIPTAQSPQSPAVTDQTTTPTPATASVPVPNTTPAPIPIPTPEPVPTPVESIPLPEQETTPPDPDELSEPEPEPEPESESEPSEPDTETSDNEPTETETSETEPAEPVPMPETEPAPPVNVSCTANATDIQASTLSLINTARATARSCGGTVFEAAAPLTWSTQLSAAALVHSDDMALHNFFSHTGSDGSSVSQRVDAQQYDWRTIGENIAAGQPTTDAVIQAWLDSPGHCQNIMNPNFEETAVVCVENNGSQYRQYWTHVIGTSF